jgi:hypothetical protein
LKAAAVLVAKRKAVEQVFDREEAGVLEIRGAARADAFQELERRRQKGLRSLFARLLRKGVEPLFAHWTIMA